MSSFTTTTTTSMITATDDADAATTIPHDDTHNNIDDSDTRRWQHQRQRGFLNNSSNNKSTSNSSINGSHDWRWSFRPTVLQDPNYPSMSIQQITDQYVEDNDRAIKEGVIVPPRPVTTASITAAHRTCTMTKSTTAVSTAAAGTTSETDIHTSAAQHTTMLTKTIVNHGVGRVSPSPNSLQLSITNRSGKRSRSSSRDSTINPMQGNMSIGSTNRLADTDAADSATDSSGVEGAMTSSASASSRSSSLSSSKSPPSFLATLRTVQWNIQAFTSPDGQRSPTITAGIIDTINDADADVVVLNEYHWNDRQPALQDKFEQECLHQHGYNNFYCGSVATPSLIASRLPVVQFVEIVLSHERSAMCILVDNSEMAAAKTTTATTSTTDDEGKTHSPTSRPGLVWVIGTHLDAFDGQQRSIEIGRLLTHLKINASTFHPAVPILLMGDFNQQRQRDYSPEEWRHITASMHKRSVCSDDGVATLLEQNGFRCVFDVAGLDDMDKHHTSTGATRLSQSSSTTTVQTNWSTSYPPSTHWSGTTIDYCYSTGNVAIDGVFISPAGFSDHRMTVCDWSMPMTPTQCQQSQSSSSWSSSIGVISSSVHVTAGTTANESATATNKAGSLDAVFVDDHDSASTSSAASHH